MPLPVQPVGQALHQPAALVANERHAGQRLVAQQIRAVVAQRRRDALGQQAGDRLGTVRRRAPGREVGIGRGERDGDPAAVAAAIGVLLRHAVFAVAAAGGAVGGIGGRGEDLLADGERRDFALREIEEAAFAGAARLHDGGDHHAGGEQRDDLVGIVHVHAGDARLLALVAGERGNARGGVERAAERDVHALGAGVALAGDRGEHEARIDRAQVLVAEARAIEHAAAEILDHHVALLRQFADHPLAFGCLEVEGKAALVAVGEAELRRAVPPVVLVVGLADDAEGIEVGARFDLDHVGAEIGEHRRRVGAGRQQPEVEHADAGEGSSALCLPSASLPRLRGRCQRLTLTEGE